MEQLPNGFTLNLPEGAFPLSTDSMVLSHFVRLPKNARVLDLGSGCGTLGLLLCAVNESCRVTGVELSQSAHLGRHRQHPPQRPDDPHGKYMRRCAASSRQFSSGKL